MVRRNTGSEQGLDAVIALLDQVNREFAQRFNGSSLTQAQWAALRYYMQHDEEEATVGNFGTYFRITPSSASQSTTRLKEKGFIKKVPFKTDARQHHVVVTAKGRRHLQSDPLHEILEIVDKMKPTQIAGLASALTDLVNALVHASVE